ncbi:LysR family transcriptional regulator [Pseudonocardia sp. WMMC193]|uniref:LysR family transcriptional regulator n=1 Tax=Pseudonocardia sp. WMMC193 TaxID=2911965 RepID=UPI001F1BAD27|nr:LysR family transcriptional regulator substrate-binding protein [Pseudonocardia sp. WMMC193]MCF7548199.1 LysR substrate-binding domain-containing protein [Pseudonocardia sp. WMMC193]
MTVALPQLRALVAVVDAGGFGAAAARLGVSQSAVSHAIAALERAAGRPVVARGVPISPTLLGRRLVEHARIAVAAAAAAEDLLRDPAENPSGAVTLAAPPTACHAVLPDLLAGWSAEYPDLRVVLLEGEDDEVVGWLEDGTADLAIVVDPGTGPAEALPVAADGFQVVLRTDHPLAGERSVDVADLADDPLLLSTGGCERQIRELYRQAGCAFTPTHRVRQLSTLFSMVRAGIGVSLVPGLAAGMEGAGLVLVPVAQHLRRELVLTGPARRPWRPGVAQMIDVVRARRAA